MATSTKKKDVIVIVDKDRIEELRSHYGIKKVLQAFAYSTLFFLMFVRNYFCWNRIFSMIIIERINSILIIRVNKRNNFTHYSFRFQSTHP